MECIVTRLSDNKLVTPAEMKVGDIGVILAPGNESIGGLLVLRVYEGLVSLRDPKKTWTGEKTLEKISFKVELLAPGDKVTLTQE